MLFRGLVLQKTGILVRNRKCGLKALLGLVVDGTRLSQVKGAAGSRCRAVDVTERKGCMPAPSLLLCRPDERT